MKTHQERFEAKYEKSDGCWNWVASKTVGYGQFWFSGLRQLAHRVSYQLYVGEIPGGLFVLHRCDNPACVNPAHLFLGTQADNMHDCISKGRNYLPDHLGENNGSAKLTEEQVKTIRARRSTGTLNIDLAREYGVDRNTISNITSYRNWAKT